MMMIKSSSTIIYEEDWNETILYKRRSNNMDTLINAIDAFAIELRQPQINYSVCDILRLNIDKLADCNRPEIDDLLLYRKIKDIGYIYHNTNIENVKARYNLVGMCYYCIDKLHRLNNN